MKSLDKKIIQLVESTPLSISQVARKLGVMRSTATKHLERLSSKGYLSEFKCGPARAFLRKPKPEFKGENAKS
jgi:predicted ArsR family transcriptional regulator